MSNTAEDIDLQQCEHCDKASPIEAMTRMDDGWFCEGCMAAWRACFDACEHQWRQEPYYDAHGDEGRICERCSGFVANEDAAALGISFQPAT